MTKATKALEWNSVGRLGAAAVRRLSLAAVGAGVATLLLATLTTSPVRAQSAAEVNVAVRGGMLSFDEAASIQNALVLGLDAMYGVNQWLSVGPSLLLGRPNTQGEHFVSAISYGVLNLGDTTSFFKASQPINVLDGALNMRVRLPANETWQPYATGGIGGYVLFLDTQVNRGATTKSALSFNVGAGLVYSLGDRGGVVLDVRGVAFNDYDRTILDPRNSESSRIENTLWAEDWKAAPENKSTVMNFAVTLGFTYTPQIFGGGR